METSHTRLAPKELAYLSARAHGYTSKEVARQFGVSYRTVEGAMKRVLYKMEARRVAEAIYKATSEGLICAFFTLGVALTVTQFHPDQDAMRTSAARVRARTNSSLRIRTRGEGYA